MVRRWIWVVLLASGLWIGPVAMQPSVSSAQGANLQSEIDEGACGDGDVVVAELTDASVAAGEPQGAAGGITAATSYTSVPIALDALLATDHAISVMSDGDLVACGEVGGVVAPNGSLAVVLVERDDSGASGVAFLAPDTANPSLTNASLFLNPSSSRAGAKRSDSGTAQTPSAEDGSDVVAIYAPDVDLEAQQTQVAQSPTEVPALGSSVDSPVPIGATLEADGLAVTVQSAYFDYSFANAIPRGGYKVLILQVGLKNVSDRNQRYDAAAFSGIDADTNANYNAVTLENVGVLLYDGDLDPGEYVSGTVLIEVQETATNVIVKYDPNMFTTDDLYWS
jgi:hypothetical protein